MAPTSLGESARPSPLPRSSDRRAPAPRPGRQGPPTHKSPRWNMRTQMLGRTALWLGALALLGGAGAARAQSPAAAPDAGYPTGRSQQPSSQQPSSQQPSSQQAPSQQAFQAPAPASYWYTGYGQGGQPAYTYYPGYGVYPSYGDSYPNYNWGNQWYQGSYPYQYPRGSYPPGKSAVPAVPLGPDELPGDDGTPAGKALAGEPAHHDRFWFAAGYDSSWIKPWKLPALVTTGSPTPPPGVDPATYHAGGLGQPTTTVLFGEHLDFGRFDGVRLSAGVFLDEAGHFAVEGIGFVQFARGQEFAVRSDATGNPFIARPVFNVVDQVERAFVDAKAGLAAGGVAIDTRSQLLGAELNLRYGCCLTDHLHLDALLGFRFLRLGESLTIRDSLEPLPGSGLTFNTIGVTPPETLADVDSFKTVNHFYGLQLGGGAGWEGKWLYANAFGKVGIGVTDQEVDINGSTTLFSPNGPQSAGGGILALPSNIGNHTRTEIGFVPEGGFNFGVKVTPCLRLTAGYSFLYWNAVVRPGAQIDRGVNANQVPTDSSFGSAASVGGPQRPAFHFNTESYWVNTLTFMLDFHY
jgi:hypothetical protein